MECRKWRAPVFQNSRKVDGSKGAMNKLISFDCARETFVSGSKNEGKKRKEE